MELAVILTMIITMSLWAYSNLYHEKGRLRYAHGYLVFSAMQWILVAINLVAIYSWMVGLIAFGVLLLGGTVLITNHSTNHIYRSLKLGPDSALALFGVCVWALAALTLVNLFV